MVDSFEEAEKNDGKLLNLIIVLKNKINNLESLYEGYFAGINEDLKLFHERLDMIEETVDGIEFIDDDSEENEKEDKDVWEKDSEDK